LWDIVCWRFFRCIFSFFVVSTLQLWELAHVPTVACKSVDTFRSLVLKWNLQTAFPNFIWEWCVKIFKGRYVGNPCCLSGKCFTVSNGLRLSIYLHYILANMP
jgi:hypothetical protein